MTKVLASLRYELDEVRIVSESFWHFKEMSLTRKKKDCRVSAVEVNKSNRLQLDWWALIITCVISLGLLLWHWLGGTPRIPFSSILKPLFPGG